MTDRELRHHCSKRLCSESATWARIWVEKIGPATVLDIEVRAPATTHAMLRQQVERWLTGTTSNPKEAVKKAKLLERAIARVGAFISCPTM